MSIYDNHRDLQNKADIGKLSAVQAQLGDYKQKTDYTINLYE